MGVKLLLEKANVPGIRSYDVYRREGGYMTAEKALKEMTTEAIVEAECYDDAKAFVEYELIDEEINHDDWLHDYDIMEISYD